MGAPRSLTNRGASIRKKGTHSREVLSTQFATPDLVTTARLPSHMAALPEVQRARHERRNLMLLNPALSSQVSFRGKDLQRGHRGTNIVLVPDCLKVS
jgi:hypothetical protein